MRLAVIRSECSFGRRGKEQFAENLSRQLCKMDHSGSVLAKVFDPITHPGLKNVNIIVTNQDKITFSDLDATHFLLKDWNWKKARGHKHRRFHKDWQNHLKATELLNNCIS